MTDWPTGWLTDGLTDNSMQTTDWLSTSHYPTKLTSFDSLGKWFDVLNSLKVLFSYNGRENVRNVAWYWLSQRVNHMGRTSSSSNAIFFFLKSNKICPATPVDWMNYKLAHWPIHWQLQKVWLMGGRIFFPEYKPFEATTTLSRLCIGVILCSVGFPNMSC